MDLPFDVVDLPAPTPPAVGDTAPDFTRPLVGAEFWEDVSLSTLVAEGDGPTVLLFHPMDGSFPATYVWREVAGRAWHESATVVGVSISTPYAHKRLLEDLDLPGDYRLYADPGADVAETYGIAHELDGMTGVVEHRPAAFVLDEDRRVEYAWAASEWPAFPDYDAVEATIEDAAE